MFLNSPYRRLTCLSANLLLINTVLINIGLASPKKDLLKNESGPQENLATQPLDADFVAAIDTPVPDSDGEEDAIEHQMVTGIESGNDPSENVDPQDSVRSRSPRSGQSSKFLSAGYDRVMDVSFEHRLDEIHRESVMVKQGQADVQIMIPKGRLRGREVPDWLFNFSLRGETIGQGNSANDIFVSVPVNDQSDLDTDGYGTVTVDVGENFFGPERKVDVVFVTVSGDELYRDVIKVHDGSPGTTFPIDSE